MTSIIWAKFQRCICNTTKFEVAPLTTQEGEFSFCKECVREVNNIEHNLLTVRKHLCFDSPTYG